MPTTIPESPRPLASRLAIVTGASRRQGIGAAICRALAALGAPILFTHWRGFDRTQPHGADEAGPPALLAELRALGVPAEALEVDLALPEGPDVVLAAAARLGGPSILVNNAAHSTITPYTILDATALDAHYAVNVRAMALLCAGFARRYPGGPGGRIINLTSGQGLTPMPDELAYAATKGAVEALTLSLSQAVAPKMITVNAVDPGPTDTGWMPPGLKADLLGHSAFGRLGTPRDAARLVAYLASDAAQWITGQVIRSRGA